MSALPAGAIATLAPVAMCDRLLALAPAEVLRIERALRGPMLVAVVPESVQNRVVSRQVWKKAGGPARFTKAERIGLEIRRIGQHAPRAGG